MYSEEEVTQLLDALAADQGPAIENAYNKGYAAGALDYYPNSAYWEAFSAGISASAKPQATGPGWGLFAGSNVASLSFGFAAGVYAALRYTGVLK
jgi:hypothetical protein